ncbi:MAG: hypothetical protein ACRBFS_04545 [Aureispira sp.]
MPVTLKQIEALLGEKNTPCTLLEERNKVVVALISKVYENVNNQKAIIFVVEPEGEQVKIQVPGAFYLEEVHLENFIGVLEATLEVEKIDIIDLVYLRDTKELHFSIKPAIIARLALTADILLDLIYVLYGILEEHYLVWKEATKGCTCEPITLVSKEMIEALLESMEKEEK